MLKHLSLLVETKGNKIGILEFRKHLAWYIKGERNSTGFKQRAFTAKTQDEFKTIIDDMFK